MCSFAVQVLSFNSLSPLDTGQSDSQPETSSSDDDTTPVHTGFGDSERMTIAPHLLPSQPPPASTSFSTPTRIVHPPPPPPLEVDTTSTPVAASSPAADVSTDVAAPLTYVEGSENAAEESAKVSFEAPVFPSPTDPTSKPEEPANVRRDMFGRVIITIDDDNEEELDGNQGQDKGAAVKTPQPPDDGEGPSSRKRSLQEAAGKCFVKTEYRVALDWSAWLTNLISSYCLVFPLILLSY